MNLKQSYSQCFPPGQKNRMYYEKEQTDKFFINRLDGVQLVPSQPVLLYPFLRLNYIHILTGNST